MPLLAWPQSLVPRGAPGGAQRVAADSTTDAGPRQLGNDARCYIPQWGIYPIVGYKRSRCARADSRSLTRIGMIVV